MTKKIKQKVAKKISQKRATRGLRKHQPQKGIGNFKVARSDKFVKKLDKLHAAMVRNGLEDPVQFIKNGGKIENLKELDYKGLVADVKERIGDVFKLFSYNTMAAALIEAKVFEHEFKIDLKEIGLQLVSMDKTYQGLGEAMKRSKEDFAIEIFDLAGELEEVSAKLYQEIENLEPHESIMGRHLEHHAKQWADEEQKPIEKGYKAVMESVAYAFLNKITKEVV